MSSCGVGFVCHVHGVSTHRIVSWGVEAVKNLTHRGAVGADGKTGDGAGILTQIPRDLFLAEIERAGRTLSAPHNLAVGVFFLRRRLEPQIESILNKHRLDPVHWRDVPTDDDALGESALSTKPLIRHLIIDTGRIEEDSREAGLYLARREIERNLGTDVYVPSLSSRVIVYKGLLVAPQLDHFYPDLDREDFRSAFCIFHQRFSTNTLPDWTLAQPLRVLAHNGEINTVQGNRNWMSSLEHDIWHKRFGEQTQALYPLVGSDESDSASLDRIVELLVLAGYSPEHAMMMCVPPAWESSILTPGEKAFFEYQSLLMKPWDGPAAIVFTDGNTVGARLDRNGLRPLRYSITEDEIVILGSETGMIDFEGRRIQERRRLGPGEILSIDLLQGTIRQTGEIIRALSATRPYREWIDRSLLRLGEGKPEMTEPCPEMLRRQIAFGYTSEELQTAIKAMAETGKEFIFSMGDDTPLPPLSDRPQLLFRYFKQRFSQVTNPPIDPIRERTVMSLTMNLGHKRNFLTETPEHARRLQIRSPILFSNQVRELEEQETFRIERISTTYSNVGADALPSEEGRMTCCVPGPESLLEIAVRRLQKRALKAVENGAEILILSDRDISRDRFAVPSLLAVSAVFNHLREKRLANRASLVIETGEARDVHHAACLIGYGASAVYPYLAYEAIRGMTEQGVIKRSISEALLNYRTALEDGLLKVIARMGISTISSYHGAQLFDVVCLNRDVVDEFFAGSTVSLEADGLAEIEDSLIKRHRAAFEVPEPTLDFGGEQKYRKEGEWHAWTPSSLIAFNKFVKSGDYSLYREFSRVADDRPVFVRHLITYRKGIAVPAEEVEPEEEILRRFFSGAMSVGALSPEAHEVIAEACNRLGIKSNSGEGGEDPQRYWSTKNSAIKQVASGRFGVTPTYLASARDLEIKIAQGAKPGEGGHLPENKVTDYIAMLRHCRPNTLLISPPPHHDIYSIEDLAQLIHDLKQANPAASICVKLVAETGVGTVAAGVAKSYADIVQISGCEGGTGASPFSSIKNAGSYWELGLQETQKTLMESGLRHRIRLRVDGGLRTAKDVIVAALLGAEEFGFGTVTMVSAGCIMARQCHLNTCPTGIATQDERLRAKFRGKVEWLIAYFRSLAREVGEILAELGFRGLDEIIGRSDLLKVMTEKHPAVERMKLHTLLDQYPQAGPKRCAAGRNDNPAPSMNQALVEKLLPFIERGEPVEREYVIRNVDRSIPITLNYHIAMLYGDRGLPPDTLRLTFRGTAGQSFGAFNHEGMSLTLIGDANDYVAKGMFGGRIIMRPGHAGTDHHSQVIAGNTLLYGAIGGEFYAAGKVGERFAVRNSGATAIVEGAGHHLCEYMTRGVVLVLGEVGYNVGAGMTGGLIYVLDEDGTVDAKVNTSYAEVSCVEADEDRGHIRKLIERHYRLTLSKRAEEMLTSFDGFMRYFKKVVPKDSTSVGI